MSTCEIIPPPWQCELWASFGLATAVVAAYLASDLSTAVSWPFKSRSTRMREGKAVAHLLYFQAATLFDVCTFEVFSRVGVAELFFFFPHITCRPVHKCFALHTPCPMLYPFICMFRQYS